MGVKVKSRLMCFFYGRRFRPGTVFELPDGVKPSADMTVVEDTKSQEPKGKKAANKGPETFSEIAAADSKSQEPKGTEGLV